MADTTTSLTDLRASSKNATTYASLIDAIGAIRAAGRLPSSVSDTSVLGYGNMVTAEDQAAMSAWTNRGSDAKAWNSEVGRMGYELASLVAAIKAGTGGARPSAEALAAADGGDRQWRTYTDKLSTAKPAPAAKPPTEYTSIDDIADGLAALGKISSSVPRPFIVAYVYGVLNSAPDFHAAWCNYDEDPKAFEDLMPAAARSLSQEVDRIRRGPAQATRTLPAGATARQVAGWSDKAWQNYMNDSADMADTTGGA